jgi:hypothetical protein
MANGTAALDRNFSCKRGRFSADLWLEKGCEGDGDEVFWSYTDGNGRGGVVGGDNDGK